MKIIINNYKYLYEIKEMAEKSGFLYYSKVPWKKGSFISNTGRKAKNTEDIMIFSKGKARNLRPDVKKTNKLGVESFMSGTSKMLPTMFDVQPVGRKDKVHQSEKPVGLWLEILEYVTLEGEIVLDQFAGVGAVGEAALKTGRNSILIEIDKNNVEKINDRLSNIKIEKEVNK